MATMGLGVQSAEALLGASPTTWERIKAGAWKQTMTQDQLMRASALIGVHKGLHLVFAEPLSGSLRGRSCCRPS